jgi:arsenate reductase
VHSHSSARSRIAEGPLRHLAGDRFEAYCAGTEATRVRPEAISVMAEFGTGISGQEWKTLELYLRELFEYVVTDCDDVNEVCPVFPGARERLHWSFEDPSRAEGGGAERLAMFRWVSDEILAYVEAELAAAN